MVKIIFIGLGGAIGAIGRYLLSGWVHTRYEGIFPLGTFVVNILGTFLLGFLMILFTEKYLFSPVTRSVITIGIIGAFTTFSTFSIETINLIEMSLWKSAITNIFLSVSFGLFSGWLGIITARLL